jgi:hypothetical protein
MTCPGCGKETRVCVVWSAGPECPTPVCVECADKELRQTARLREAEEARVAAALEEAGLRDRVALLWARAAFAVLVRLGRRTLEPPGPFRSGDALEEPKAKPRHTTRVFNPPGQYEGDESRYDVECDLCGWIAAADSFEEAETIARLHEEFVAVLVDSWEIVE